MAIIAIVIAFAVVATIEFIAVIAIAIVDMVYAPS